MEKANAEPDTDIFNTIVSDIRNLAGIPRGEYSVILNDNFIDKSRAMGTKENTLKTYGDIIIK